MKTDVPEIKNMGLLPYGDSLDLQKSEKEKVLSGLSAGKIMVLEHSPPAFTLGRNKNRSNFLVRESFIMKLGIEIHESARGGDITFHEPGQVVAYYIVPLKPKSTLDFTSAVFSSAAAFIEAEYGIVLSFNSRYPGLWHEDAKVCFGGFDLSGGVSSHGISINVSNRMEGFDLINPCGFPGIKVTSISRIAGSGISSASFRKKFTKYLAENPLKGFRCS